MIHQHHRQKGGQTDRQTDRRTDRRTDAIDCQRFPAS